MCDFGFARTMSSADHMYTDYVSTRWYRAPELLVGDTNYGKEVDVWAIGCLFFEILTGDPLFPGDSDLNTLHQIMSTVGHGLTEKQRTAFHSNPIFEELKLPEITNKTPLEEKLEEVEEDAMEFLKRCLSLDPSSRGECRGLLEHRYFDEIREWYSEEISQLVELDSNEFRFKKKHSIDKSPQQL